MALDTRCNNFDNSKSEQIALNVDGSDRKATSVEEKSFPSGLMDHQILSSSKVPVDSRRYAVGVLGANELHITPLNSILNLRPNLAYLDKADKTGKSEGRGNLNATSDAEDANSQDEDDVKTVNVRFAKTNME